MTTADYLKKLVEFKTFAGNPDKAEAVGALYDWALTTLPKGFKHERFVSNGHESLVIYSQSLENPEIVLQAHIDVVPGDDSQFQAVEQDGRLYARGASDMKFAAAAYLAALHQLDPKKHNVAVWLTSDEEIGGENGVQYLLEKKGLRCSFCVLPDGVNNDAIVSSAKGVWHIELTARGKSAHGSRPWLGENAITKLFAAYEKLVASQIFTNSSEGCTINLGKITGGMAANSVPDLAHAWVDFRFVKNDDFSVIKSAVEALSNMGVSYQPVVFGAAFNLDTNNSYVQKYLQVLKANNTEYHFEVDQGSSDARFFSALNIPVVLHKPVCGGDHSESEWIDLTSLGNYSENLQKFLSV